MSLCDTCTKPGACCKGFALFPPSAQTPHTDWSNEDGEGLWRARVRAFLSGTPFVPVAAAEREVYFDEESGRRYSSYTYECPKLGKDGRCTVYADRPQTCRDYEAGSSRLCVMFKEAS